MATKLAARIQEKVSTISLVGPNRPAIVSAPPSGSTSFAVTGTGSGVSSFVLKKSGFAMGGWFCPGVIVKCTVATSDSDEPSLASQGAGYAFAHWGGNFWVFLQKMNETYTTVYEVDGQTGQIKSMTPAQGRTIVGAGVSTCAPTVIL